MNFHWPSFLLGYGTGVLTTLLAKRLRPVLLEVASAAGQIVDSVGASLAMRREDLEDVLAEVRARVVPHAGHPRVRPRPSPPRKRAPKGAAARRSSASAGSRPGGRRRRVRKQSA